MKVFKITINEFFYGIYAQSKNIAIGFLGEELGKFVADSIEEIPEEEWDSKTINIWEDNDFSKKPFKTSIRESICGKETQLIFTNDFSTFS